jgi:hypothetical protein
MLIATSNIHAASSLTRPQWIHCSSFHITSNKKIRDPVDQLPLIIKRKLASYNQHREILPSLDGSEGSEEGARPDMIGGHRCTSSLCS